VPYYRYLIVNTDLRLLLMKSVEINKIKRESLTPLQETISIIFMYLLVAIADSLAYYRHANL